MLTGVVGIMTKGTFDMPSLMSSTPKTVSPTDNKTTTGTTSNATSTPAPALLKVTAKELADAYKTGKAAAETKYKGKVCTITGKVDSLSAADTPFVLLTSGVQNEVGAKCMFTLAYRSSINALEPGQEVTVQGTVGDYNVDVIVNDCSFVK
jgi:hypothetical protein